MMLSAACESTRGIFVPTFEKEFGVSDNQIAYIFTASSIAYILFTYIGGILCEKLGQKKVFIIGFISILISFIVLYFTYNFSLLIISMFLMNIGLSLNSISINTLVPILFISFQALLMNLTHFCYGLGTTLSQRITGILIYKGIGWKSIYIFIALIYLVVFILLIFTKVPEPHKVEKKQEFKNYIFKDKLFYYYMMALGFYVFAEIGTQNWFVNFMHKTYSFNEREGSFYLALFFAIFSVGRLIGGFIVEKIGYIKSVFMSLIIAFALYITGLGIGINGMIIISISGFFFSIAFPTVVLTISRVFKKNSAYITGIIITVSSSINMIMNQLIGELNLRIGTYKAFYVIPISLLISLIFVYLIYKNTKEVLSNRYN
ncbi:MFS transporter [Clostridium tetanomorphum]|uniref:MFS transporter n=1 Tax=Clostridium tetanomorphum TaxID=1553 RepID=A0A923EEP5_CLOTT|nr:MFS transporter [Clostridium tetanomorphum]MBC2400184.1 MFS transporter [Clostridium tetanomorphum]